MDIADGIIDLIQILSIVVGGGHTTEATNHLMAIPCSSHFGLGYTGVESQFVWRVATNHFSKSTISFLLVARQVENLSHQKPLPSSLYVASFVLDDLF